MSTEYDQQHNQRSYPSYDQRNYQPFDQRGYQNHDSHGYQNNGTRGYPNYEARGYPNQDQRGYQDYQQRGYHPYDQHDYSQNELRDRSQTQQRSTILERGRAIRIMKNGDPFFTGRNFVINQKKYPMMDVFLDDASKALRANFGAVRCIYTPRHGTRVNDISDFEDHQTYVAAGGEKFKKLHYLDIADGKRISSKGQTSPKTQQLPPVRRIDVEGRALKLSRSENVIIYVYRNGDPLTLPVKVLLVKSTLQSWECVLDEITKKVNISNTAVLKLYAMNGELITSAQQLEYNGMYVAAGKERFKFVEYPDPELLSPNASPKVSRKSVHHRLKLPLRSGKTDDSDAQYTHQSTVSAVKHRYTKSEGTHTNTTTANSYGSTENVLQRRPREEYDFFNNKPQQHRRGPAKEIDFDRDDGGIYKGRLTHRERAHEIEETNDTRIEMPYDYRQAETVEDETFYAPVTLPARNQQLHDTQQPPNQQSHSTRQPPNQQYHDSRQPPNQQYHESRQPVNQQQQPYDVRKTPNQQLHDSRQPPNQQFPESRQPPNQQFPESRKTPNLQLHDSRQPPNQQFPDSRKTPNLQLHDSRQPPNQQLHDSWQPPNQQLHDSWQPPNQQLHDSRQPPNQQLHDSRQPPNQQFSDSRKMPNQQLHDSRQPPNQQFPDSRKTPNLQLHDSRQPLNQQFLDSRRTPNQTFIDTRQPPIKSLPKPHDETYDYDDDDDNTQYPYNSSRTNDHLKNLHYGSQTPTNKQDTEHQLPHTIRRQPLMSPSTQLTPHDHRQEYIHESENNIDRLRQPSNITDEHEYDDDNDNV